ncbi:Membrane protein involved in the export of O-antigen, teichoic acid lipoteichoic acids [Enterococcus faecium]|uniref:lipopolysaccharide biosynthesis protein n=1 Tax=Enterococcus faecium TaxID=1352 RepID=UPI000989A50A|nr:oligosaccharide flippase family protein [Enterococcus faecium]SJX70688.1 Membrane protein involved in the export of O-antigen, teichoic acid lipoteichoic acids [Enterococcus faecium]
MKKTVKDIFYNAIYQVFLIVLPLLTIPILSRRIGSTGLGIYGYVFSISQFLMTVIAVGMNPFRIRNIAKSRKDKKALSLQFWNIYFLQFLIGLSVSFLYIAYIYFFDVKYKNLYLIQLIFIVGLTLDISWFFQGIEEFSKVVIRNTVIKLSSVLLIILFVSTKDDLWIYVFITSITNFLGSLVFWLSIHGKVGKPLFNSNVFKQLWKPAFIILTPQLFMQVYTTLDKTIVGYFVDPTALSYYDQSQKIARIILAVLTSITIVMLPKISKAQAEGKSENILVYTKKSFDYTIIIALILFSVVFINTKEFVPWFFGENFKPMTINMLISCLIIVVSPIGGVFANQFAIAIEKDKEYAYPMIIGAIVSIIGNVAFVPTYGAVAATIVLVVVELLVFFFRVFFVRKEIKISYFFGKNVILFFIVNFTLTTSAYYFLPQLFSSSFLDMAIKSIMIFIIYLPFVYFLFPDIRNEVRKIIRK